MGGEGLPAIPVAHHRCDVSFLVALERDADPLDWCSNCGSLVDGAVFHPPQQPIRARAAPPRLLSDTFASWWVSEFGCPPENVTQRDRFYVSSLAYRAATNEARPDPDEWPFCCSRCGEGLGVGDVDVHECADRRERRLARSRDAG